MRYGCAGYTTAIYQAAAAMTPGGYGMATYPWDLSNIANAIPATQKTSLLEVRRRYADAPLAVVA